MGVAYGGAKWIESGSESKRQLIFLFWHLKISYKFFGCDLIGANS
jgi:hypothetical protein